MTFPTVHVFALIYFTPQMFDMNNSVIDEPYLLVILSFLYRFATFAANAI